jgi:esterase/lipase superfamily enzyme
LAPAAQAQAPAGDQRLERARGSIVLVETILKKRSGAGERTLTATGFAVAGGRILTALGAVPATDSEWVAEYRVTRGSRQGQKIPVTVLYRDAGAGVAVLVPPAAAQWPVLALAPAGSLRDGAALYALGFPANAKLALAEGRVAGRGAGGRWLTTLPAGYAGSGAPVFDGSGRILGMALGAYDTARRSTPVAGSDTLEAVLAAAPRSAPPGPAMARRAPLTPRSTEGGAPPAAAPPAPSPPVATAPPDASRSVAPRSAPKGRAERMEGEAKPATPQPAPGVPAAQQSDWDVVPVFYGTDRARKNEPKRIVYTSDRGRRLELGQALVTVPKIHQVPQIERPFAIRIPYFDVVLYEQAEDPKVHFTVRELKALTRADFIKLVRQRVGGSRAFKDQAVVFVHGYNNTFDYALFRTAQMAYDLKFDGAAFLYSWPSGTGLTGYYYDRESSTQAEPYLREFLELVIKDTGAKSVSIIAHSMGNLPLLHVLRDLGPALPAGVQLNQIILAAPDVDRNVFENLAANIKRYGRGVTLYCSANDRAMAAARRVAGGVPRAGDVPREGPIVLSGIDTIDVTQTSTDYLALNHSSYAERSALLNDIGLLLQTGERPPERRIPILQRIKTPRGDFWRYPLAR